MNRSRRNPRSAFTLVEVLLTTVLAAVLLVALWSLLSMYSKAFESGHARTEQAQLARALLEEISSDLQNVVQLPLATAPAQHSTTGSGGAIARGVSESAVGASVALRSGPLTTASAHSMAPGAVAPLPGTPTRPTAFSATSAPTRSMGAAPAAFSSAPSSETAGSDAAVATNSLRPAGLFGTSSFLQIDVMQAAPIVAAPQMSPEAAMVERAAPRADELRTIVYAFEPVEPDQAAVGAPQMHLVRREMTWAEAHPAAGVAHGTPASAAPGTPFETQTSVSASAAAISRRAGDPSATEPALLSVPEVLELSIRYFDGTAWSEEWDSMARGGMPVAVEVAMRLRSHEEPPQTETIAVGAGVDVDKVYDIKYPLHRLLIPLDTSRRAAATGGAGAGTNVEASSTSAEGVIHGNPPF